MGEAIMSNVKRFAVIAVAIASSVAIAQNKPPENKPPVAPAEKTAPAQSGATPATAGQYSTAVTTIGTLLGDPAAKAVLTKHIPTIVGNADIEQAASMTLKEVQQYAADQLTDKVLADIDVDLGKLPAKQ
jgi:para-nitrobenzyl esterase